VVVFANQGPGSRTDGSPAGHHPAVYPLALLIFLGGAALLDLGFLAVLLVLLEDASAVDFLADNFTRPTA
jgi:hypothetical protein